MASPSQQIPIRVRKATRADIDDVVRVYVDAFGPGVMDKLMYPNGMSEEAKSKLAAPMTETVDNAVASGGDVSKAKAKETFLHVAEADFSEGRSNPEVIAFAWWDIWREPRLEEEWSAPDPPVPSTADGANKEVLEAFMGGIHDMRRRNMRGDPAICIRLLCCAPTRGRLGAASALLRWVADVADKEGLPTWLEASPQGYRLYRRFGFEDVDVFDLHIGQRWGAVRSPDDDWGANFAAELAGVASEGVMRAVGMWRPPVKRS